MRNEKSVPVIEKGVPMPSVIKADRRKSEFRGRPPSIWPAFLRSLVSGDSFVLEYPDAATIKTHARTLGIRLHWEQIDSAGMCKERFWKI